MSAAPTDALMMRIVDILYSVPFVPFVIVLTVLFGRELWLIFLAIGAVSWLDIARIVRGQTLSLKQREFVEAARVSGVRGAAMIARHIVPNLIGIVIIYATLTIPTVILFEAFLSFLGLGVQSPLASLGSLVADGASEMQSHPHLLIVPAVFPGRDHLLLQLPGRRAARRARPAGAPDVSARAAAAHPRPVGRATRAPRVHRRR